MAISPSTSAIPLVGGLSDGTFGFDRWNSVGATNFTLSNGVVILASGKVRQVTEAPKLAGETVVVSLKNPSGTVAVALGSASGSGTQSYSLPISPPVAYTPIATRLGSVVSGGSRNHSTCVHLRQQQLDFRCLQQRDRRGWQQVHY